MKASCKACGLSLAGAIDEKQARQIDKYNNFRMVTSPGSLPEYTTRVSSEISGKRGLTALFHVPMPKMRSWAVKKVTP
jgi:hypothetical protein